MDINLALLQPPNFGYTQAFQEVIDLYTARLRDLGHSVRITENGLHPRLLNLVIGYHLLAAAADYPPPGVKYIVLQFDQLRRVPFRQQLAAALSQIA